jgi:hypothetical protein
MTNYFVAPANAGVQGRAMERLLWIPAFAGMTIVLETNA